MHEFTLQAAAFRWHSMECPFCCHHMYRTLHSSTQLLPEQQTQGDAPTDL